MKIFTLTIIFLFLSFPFDSYAKKKKEYPRTEFLYSLISTPDGKAVHDKMMCVGVKKAIETGDHSYVPTKQGSLYVFLEIDYH